MEHLIAAVRMAVDQSNWYAALAVALTMPDICGRLEAPENGPQARFVSWYDRFLLRRYRSRVGGQYGEVHTFLSGRDCYALRCAFVHQGEFGVDDQRAREALQRFHFTAPRSGQIVHINQNGDTLQLQVDLFCLDMCQGVEEWLVEVRTNPQIQERIAELGQIAD